MKVDPLQLNDLLGTETKLSYKLELRLNYGVAQFLGDPTGVEMIKLRSVNFHLFHLIQLFQ